MTNTSEEESKRTSSEHTKNKRPSTKGKHQKGQKRQKKDQEGYKGYNFPPRRRPPKWKGPWPPKN